MVSPSSTPCSDLDLRRNDGRWRRRLASNANRMRSSDAEQHCSEFNEARSVNLNVSRAFCVSQVRQRGIGARSSKVPKWARPGLDMTLVFGGDLCRYL